MQIHILLGLALAQSSCSTLPKNTPCGPDFEGYPINRSVQDFVSNLNRFTKLDTLAQLFQQRNICSAQVRTGVENLRYMVGLQCLLVVRESLESCPLPAGMTDPRFCTTECELGSASFQKLVTNTTMCPEGQVLTVEGSTGARIQTTCKMTPGIRCLRGTPEERANCGFLTYELAKQQCAGLSDSCCKALNEQLQGEETRRIVIIVTSVVGGTLLLILIGITIFCWRRRRRVKENPKGFVVHRAEQVSHPMTDLLLQPTFHTKNDSQKTMEDKDVFTGKPSFLENQRLTFTALHQPSPVVSNRPPPPTSLLQSVKETSQPSGLTYNTLSRRTGASDETQEVIRIEDLPAGTVRVMVTRGYEAQLEDELDLKVGRPIFLVRPFDDGWGLGVDPVNGKQGAFPLVCADFTKPTSDEKVEKVKGETVNDSENPEARRSSTVLEPPSVPREEILRGPETKKLARRLSSMILQDLAKSGTRSKVPLSTYLQQTDTENAFGAGLFPASYQNGAFLDNEVLSAPQQELLRGPDTKKIGRRNSSLVLKDLAKNGTRSKVSLADYLKQVDSSLDPVFLPIDSSLLPPSSEVRSSTQLVNDITNDLIEATTPQTFPASLAIDTKSPEVGKADGSRSKVPYSAYLMELDGLGESKESNDESFKVIQSSEPKPQT